MSNKRPPAQDERAQRLMAMGEMAASLAHEIRNPLGSMELYCTLLKKDLQTQPGALALAEQIHQGIRTLDRIITNSLQFSRDITPKIARVEQVQELLDETVAFAHARAEQVDLVCKVEGTGPVFVDRYLVTQALLNVVLNGIDAAAERTASGGRGQVTITSTVTPHGEWRVSVHDNGRGIGEADYARIFDPFFTTKKGGTGLGLPIVHSIVTAHDGTIAIESSEATGTNVIISWGAGLPAARFESMSMEEAPTGRA